MLLAIDIGNTNIVIGVFDKATLGGTLKHKWRVVTDYKKTVDDYAVDMIELFLNNKIDCLEINGCAISSVVPIITPRIYEAVKKFLNQSALEKLFVVGHDKVKLNLDIKVKNKSEVGHDRLVNAIAGFQKYSGNLIIIDFGTATTFDVVGENGEYLGGVISPGINLSLKALHDMTAQLPKITIKAQKNIIGKSTVEAMNSGVYHGYIAMVEGMVKKINTELDSQATVIITGGLAEIFKEPLITSGVVNYHQPDLTLDGLKIIFQQHI